MLKIKNLKKIYNSSNKGIKELNLEINPGDICAFIGSNGAGKTTTLKSIVGIHPFDEGEVILNGVNIEKKPKKFKELIGYAPDNPEIYENLRGDEYLNFIASIYGMTKYDYHTEVEYLSVNLGLKDRLSKLYQDIHMV